MKSLVPLALPATVILALALAAGCASREVKTTTTYVPETPNVVVQPPPVVVTPPAVSSVEPSTNSTSQTTTTYRSSRSSDESEPGSESMTRSYRTHSESSTVRSVPAPPPQTSTIYQEHDYQVTTPGTPDE